MRRVLITIFLSLIPFQLATAQSTAGAIFLLISPGAAAGGTGEAHVAATNDAYASWWNPASLAFLPQREFVGMRVNWLPSLASDMYYNYIGFRSNIPDVGTFGGHLIYLDLGKQERRDENNVDLGTFISYMVSATVSFGTQLSRKSAIGLNFKIIHQNLSNTATGAEKGKGVSTDFAFDVAYMAKQWLSPRLDFGALVSNIGPKIAFIDEAQADPAPTNLKMGIKYRLIDSEYNKLSVMYDMNKLLVASYPGIDYDNDGQIGNYDEEGNWSPGGGYSKDGKREEGHTDPWYIGIFTSWWNDWKYSGDVDRNTNLVIDDDEAGNADEGSIQDELDTITHNVGLEYWYSSYFAVRVGYIYDKLGKIHNITYGAGIRFGGYGFDFGYISGEEGHPLTNTMRFSLNMVF